MATLNRLAYNGTYAKGIHYIKAQLLLPFFLSHHFFHQEVKLSLGVFKSNHLFFSHQRNQTLHLLLTTILLLHYHKPFTLAFTLSTCVQCLGLGLLGTGAIQIIVSSGIQVEMCVAQKQKRHPPHSKGLTFGDKCREGKVLAPLRLLTSIIPGFHPEGKGRRKG